MRKVAASRAVLAAAAAALAMPAPAVAADTWTNGAGTRLWSAGGNWADGTEPTANDDVTFPTPIPVPAGSGSLLLSAGETARTLTFNDSYSLLNNVTGASLNLTIGSVIVNGVHTADIEVNVTGVGGLLFQTTVSTGALILGGTNTYTGGTIVGTGTLQLGSGGAGGSIVGNVEVKNLATLAFNHSVTTGFLNTITGLGNVNKLGTNLLALDADNTYTGGTTVSGGTLQIGNGGTSGSIVGNVTDNATLSFSRSDDVTFAGAISGTGAVSKMGSNTLALTGNSTYTGGTTIASGGTLQIGAGSTSGSITGNVANSGTLTFHRSDDLTFAGVVSGTGKLVKLGSNKLTLTSNNTATGTTTIAGTLQLGDGGTTGTIASNVVDNGTLAFNRSDDLTFGGIISGAGGLTKLGTNTLTLSVDDTYTGVTTVSAGALQIGAGGTTGSIGGNVTDNGTVVFNRIGTKIFASVISGTGAVTKAEGGTLVLTGDNTYTGGTTIAGGTLQLGSGPTPGSIVGDVADGGTLAFNHSDDVTYAGVVSGSGGLTKSGAGALVLTANHTYAGTTVITQGTLQLGGGGTTGSLGSNNSVADNGTLALNRSDNFTFDGFISGSGGLVKLGANTVTLTADNSFGGGTTISAGTLQLGNGGFSGVVSGAVTDNGTLAFNHGVAKTFAGAITGSGSVTKLGSNLLTFTANSTYTGGTTISGGTLRLGNGSTSGSIAGDVVTSGTLEVNRSDDTTFAGAISGGGGVSKLAANTLTLTGSNTYGGATAVSAGTLVFTRTYTSGSTLLVLSGATVRLAHSATTPNNVVLKTGSVANVSGKLDLTDNKLIVTATAGGSWNGSAYTGVTGMVASARGDGTWNGNGITTTWANGDYVTLGVASAAEVKGISGTATDTWAGQTVHATDALVMYTYGGDATLDGQINIDDYTQIDSSVSVGGVLKGWFNGDFNYDGNVDIDDYTIIDSNIGIQGAPFSTAGAASPAGVTAVPEPAAVGLLGILCCALRRRRRAEARANPKP